MENLNTYKLHQTGPETQTILDQVNTNTTDIERLKDLYQAFIDSGVTIIESSDWPVSNPQEKVIYRVTGESSYTDYMWNGTEFVEMATYDNAIDNVPTYNSNNLVKSGGVFNELSLGAVFDVTAHNSGTTFASLEALLSDANLSTLIPTSVRKGGMSIKFVESSDNNYVQYRLMKNTWSINVADWQGVDSEPILGSVNLITNDGANLISKLFSEVDIYINKGVGYITSGIKVFNDTHYRYKITNPIPCKYGDQFGYNGSGRNLAFSWFIRKGTTILAKGQYEGSTNVEITQEEADNIIFASFKGTSDADTVVLNVELPYTTISEKINTGMKYFGVATPSLNPQTPSVRGYYIAYEDGVYTHFGVTKNSPMPVCIVWDTNIWRVDKDYKRTKILNNVITPGFISGSDLKYLISNNDGVGLLLSAYVSASNGMPVINSDENSYGNRAITNFIRGNFTLILKSSYSIVNVIEYDLAGKFITSHNTSLDWDKKNRLTRLTIAKVDNTNFDGTEIISDIIESFSYTDNITLQEVYASESIDINEPIIGSQTNIITGLNIKKGTIIFIKPTTQSSWLRLLIGYNENNNKRLRDNIKNGEEIYWQATEDVTSLWYYVTTTEENFSFSIEINADLTQGKVLNNAVYEYITGKLAGKTVYSFGDSLVYGHYSRVGMLDGLCKENGMIYTKYAFNGAQVIGGIIVSINNASDVEPDFVVFDGLTNDAYDSVVSEHLGAITSGYSGSYDTTTFYGSFENIIYTLRNKYPNTNIIYVAPHNMPTRSSSAQETLHAAVKEVCQKWSIPMVDIYHDGQINTNIDVMRIAWSYNNQGETSGGNGTHLTGEGYDRWYAPNIKEMMLKLLD